MNWSIVASRSQRLVGMVVLGAALWFLAGCSGNPVGTVSGKVTYKGKAVTTGTVNFINPTTGTAADPARLDASGAFKLSNPLGAGTYKVYLQPPQPEPVAPGKKVVMEPFSVPQKFQNPQTTTLSFEVKVGDNDFPIELK